MEMHIYLIQLVTCFVDALRTQITDQEAKNSYLTDGKLERGLARLDTLQSNLYLMERLLEKISADDNTKADICETVLYDRQIMKRLYPFAKWNRVRPLNSCPEFETPQDMDCYRHLAFCAAETCLL